MLENVKSVYFIGIGGISMSALAFILKNRGIYVCGSDATKSEQVENLVHNGIDVKIGKAPKFVQDSDIIVCTGAICEDNSDLKLARKLNKKIYSRAEILGMLSKEFDTISVAGSHGKTTTTGMIASVLLENKKDPTVHIGGILNNIDSNVYLGNSKYLVTEACEYKDSFLSLENYISVVLNIKEDHLDYFHNLDNIYKSFTKFTRNTKKNGCIVLNFDDFLAKKLKQGRNCITFGIENNADFMAKNIKIQPNGRYQFDICYHDKKLVDVLLPCFGYHNIYNALATFCCCHFLGVKTEEIKRGIESFKGIKRRFEFINEINNKLIIHDYAHHPDELKASITAGRELGKKKLITIFQPHTFSRTRDLYDEFLTCFNESDEVWLLPVYPAREKPIKGVSSYRLYLDLKKKGVAAKYFNSFEKCKESIIHQNQDILFEILGAGDIEKLAYSLKEL